MYSEKTELHLQHMIERVQMGMQGEEKQIEELLFDEVYTIVYTIYKNEEKTNKAVHIILKKYIEGIKDRKILDIHKNVQMYAVLKIYQALCRKNGELYVKTDFMQDYDFEVIADDVEFEAVADTYADAFESVRAYKSKPDIFKNLKAQKMIIAVLYMYEKCTVAEMSRVLKLNERVVRNEISLLRGIVLKAGKSKSSVYEEKDIKDRERFKKPQKSHEEEISLTEYLFPGLGKGTRMAIDILLSVIVLIVYFVIF